MALALRQDRRRGIRRVLCVKSVISRTFLHACSPRLRPDRRERERVRVGHMLPGYASPALARLDAMTLSGPLSVTLVLRNVKDIVNGVPPFRLSEK